MGSGSPPLQTTHTSQSDTPSTDKSPKSFNPIAAAESLTVLLGYEAIIETVYSVIRKYSKYAH